MSLNKVIKKKGDCIKKARLQIVLFLCLEACVNISKNAIV